MKIMESRVDQKISNEVSGSIYMHREIERYMSLIQGAIPARDNGLFVMRNVSET